MTRFLGGAVGLALALASVPSSRGWAQAVGDSPAPIVASTAATSVTPTGDAGGAQAWYGWQVLVGDALSLAGGLTLGALGGVIGYCAASGAEKGCADTGAGYGLLTGALLAATIDAALMSYEDPAGGSENARLVPFFAPSNNGALFGFAAAL